MPDELDARLLRWFAQSHQPLADAQFAARVTAQLRGRGSARLRVQIPRALPGIVLRSLLVGVRAPLRLRHAGLLALAAAVVTLCSALLGV